MNPEAMTSGSRHRAGLCLIGGHLLLGLGLLGMALPVLPTTPFLLVAAACYARASRRFYNALLNNRLLGPAILEWQQHRAIAWRTKLMAIALMSLTLAMSIVFFVKDSWLRLALALFRDQGYEATTIEQITERADVAKGTFFNYFPSKGISSLFGLFLLEKGTDGFGGILESRVVFVHHHIGNQGHKVLLTVYPHLHEGGVKGRLDHVADLALGHGPDDFQRHFRNLITAFLL